MNSLRHTNRFFWCTALLVISVVGLGCSGDKKRDLGITVEPTSGLTTTEAGGTANFRVVLNDKAKKNVTINLTSSDTSEGTVSPASLTFTSTNWQIPQTVTITGVDDDVADGDISYKIVLAPAQSDDSGYVGMDADDVTVTNEDNDTPGIEVDPTDGLTTTEAGGTDTFTVVLKTQPTSSVEIGLISSNPNEGTVSPASLTFSSQNWDAPQTVTVTGVDDDVADGPQSYSIVTGAASSADTDYDKMVADDVSVTNTDNDSPGITVDPIDGLSTTEAGGTDEFTIVLNSEPTADVVIGVSSSDTSEGSVSPSSLTFTSNNWDALQIVTITGVDDFSADGNQTYTIVTAPALSDDTGYNDIDAQDASVTNVDNDTAGISVNPSSGLVTTEAGTTATFTVVLNTKPTADVTIPLSSSDPAEGTVSPASLTFTSTNWDAARTVTVTGVDDDLQDGSPLYTILTGPAVSTDPSYAGLNADDVSVTNTDNDTAGITVDPITGLTTSEAGGSAEFSVVLNSEPTADVTIGISSSDTAEGQVSPSSITFTPQNWNAPIIVTITGQDDDIQDGSPVYTILTAPAVSDDTNYSGLDAQDVSVTNTDNDTAGITVDPKEGLVTTEAGGSDTFTIVLNSEPTADVVIDLSSSDEEEGTVSPASLTFTNVNWGSPQVVTVTGVNDDVQDGSPIYTIVTAAAQSADTNYNGLDAANVSVTNTDNDTAGITVDPISGLTTSEAGQTAEFTVVLNSKPTANVTIALASSDENEGTISPTSLTFTPLNWHAPRTVTVTGEDDAIQDGSPVYTIVLSPAQSDDTNYQDVDPTDVTVTNTDNDTAGISVQPMSGLVTTEAGGTDQFTIVLNSEPTDDVTITLASNDMSEGAVNPTTITFTSLNWNAPRIVTVTGVNDDLQDGSPVYTIVIDAATSNDTNYAGINPNDVTVTNTDNDTAGITVEPTEGLSTTESGGTDEFTIVLNSEPTGDVTILLGSSDENEGTVSPSSVTFTSVNWKAAQVVTVTGVDDDIEDGSPVYTIVTDLAQSSDPNYNGINPADVSVTNVDNDTAGITVVPISGLTTTEATGPSQSDTFTIVLNSQPTANVTIGLETNNSNEGYVTPASVTFTSDNWNAPQMVTVTGRDDDVADSNQPYSVITAVAVSGDTNYNGLDPDNVSVTNIDDDSPGITVEPTSGLVTTEWGVSDTFSVVLNSQPTDSVVIGLSSSDETEGTVLPASFTFTTLNWNAPQFVTVTGVDDGNPDGNQSYTIITADAVSNDANYSGRVVPDVSVTNTDDDTPGILVSPTSDLSTTEGGGTDSFEIVLIGEPTANVVINLASSDTTEGDVNPISVTFTPDNWNAPQTITVIGEDDDIQDGNQPYTIEVQPATSTDPDYSGREASDVSVTNVDNDSAGVTVDPIDSLVTSESGGTDSFTVVLNSEPANDVIITLESSDANEGVPSPASVTFTPTNWNAPQTVTVSGRDDDIADGNQLYSILVTVAFSLDANYAALDPDDVSVSNTDNDSAGVTVNPLEELTTTEAGASDSFTIVLNSEPTSNVTIYLLASDETEATASPSSVVFTPANWNAPQTVYVTGEDDAIADGDQVFSILTSPAESDDQGYAGIDPVDVPCRNLDNDTAGIIVSPIDGLVTTEAGGSDSFMVFLNSQPTADVVIGISIEDTTEGSASPSSLTFTSLNWNAPQSVTVTGVDDVQIDGDQVFTVETLAAVSADLGYNGLNPANVEVTNNDNDTAGITITPVAGLLTTEAGGTTTFTILLDTPPSENVVIGLSSSDESEGTVSPASVTFTPVNWAAPQTVTLTGQDDVVADGNQPYTIVTAPAVTGDADYTGMDASDVSVTNVDNDSASVTVLPTVGLVTTEGGGSAEFSVYLNSQPGDDVIIDLSSSNTDEGTVSPSQLTFTSDNWNSLQIVTVTGVDDLVADGNQPYSIITSNTSCAGDDSYDGLVVADVSVTNTDNDSAGITVSPTSGLVTTEAGGEDTFTIVLNSEPTSSVVVGVSSNDLGEGTVSPASLTFTTDNWNAPQTVTITGVDDDVQDGSQVYAIVTAPAVSDDTGYDGMDAANVEVSNTDNDSAGITVKPVAGLTTTEAGDTDTFSIVLNSQPTANVTIGISSSDEGEGTPNVSSVTFTTDNWNAPQSITVTGENDDVQDGDQSYTILTAAATSGDDNYNGMDAANVSVVNTDNDSAGITVDPIADLVTTEAGGTDTFTIVLNSQPTANVSIALSSSDDAEGTVGPVSVTFTPDNWKAPQTITVTGVDDDVQDGDQPYTIVTAAATSDDANYNGRNPSNVSVSNTDNDSAGITVDPVAGLVTTEAGGEDAFTVVLNSQPTANVTIALSSDDEGEGTVSPASLTFTADNWNAPKLVTVMGVDDDVADGNQTYTIVTAAAVSTDGNYSGKDASNVAVSNTDNDSAGITVVPTEGLVTTEAGVEDTFTIVLNSEPTANVSIGLSSGDESEGMVSPASVIFTPDNWNAPQTVTVTGVNDDVQDGNQPYTIITAAAVSTDGNYSGRDAPNVSVSNTDNDSAGITVDPTGGLVTTEAAGEDTFTIVLNSEPTADVTIGLSTGDDTEGTVSPASVTFTSDNWKAPRTVTVTGVDDAVEDGNQIYTIVTAAATSDDNNYSGMNASDVSVSNTDDDTAGITVEPTEGLTTTEAGDADQFTIVLNSQPTANVTIGLSTSDDTEGTVSPASLTFTADNWKAPQTVTVTGQDDDVADGSQVYTILTAPAVSTDENYSGMDASNVLVSNTDDDSAGITVDPFEKLTTTEDGGVATFTIVLNSQPTDDVTIAFTSSDESEGTVDPASVTFTAINWNAPKTITITGVDDAVADGNQIYSIVTGAASSADSNYNGLNPVNVTNISNTDNDSAGITVDPTDGLVTTEGGSEDTFTIVLNSQPTASVTIGLSSGDSTEGSVSPASVVFTTDNWNAPQTVTVTGVNDDVADGNQLYSIITAAAVSADDNYNGFNADNVEVSNTDNDSPGITVSPTEGLYTSEAGGEATFTIVLNSEPTANVTIGLSSDDESEGTVSPASLTFTAGDWDTPQMVTITGEDDDIADGNQVYNIITAAAVSTDDGYNGVNADNVSVTNIDNDSPGITVEPTSGLETTEAGGTAEFTVVLNSEPTADVTIALTSSDLTEGTIDQASLTFTSGNWDIPQTVTITGQNDTIADGNQPYKIITSPASSADSGYDGINPADVSVTNLDDETYKVLIAPLAVVTDESGSQDQFSVVLRAKPTETVTIHLTNDNPQECQVQPSVLQFNEQDWNLPQLVTVTGLDDGIDDGDANFTIRTELSTADSNYSGIVVDDVTGKNAYQRIIREPAGSILGRASLSADGRYLAFASADSKLVDNDLNQFADVFVLDRQNGSIKLISVDNADLGANGDSLYPSISADGRYVAFQSVADNLVDSDFNEAQDIFLHDLETGLTKLISVGLALVEANGDSAAPSISADGGFVAFQSDATNLVENDFNQATDVFVYDVGQQQLTAVSLPATEMDVVGRSSSPSISADGRMVAFVSSASNLTNNTDIEQQVFMYDRWIDTCQLVSRGLDGDAAQNYSYGPTISADGRFVAFLSGASDLVMEDANSAVDVFVFDSQTQNTQLISIDSTGQPSGGYAVSAAISADGNRVAFVSAAADLVENDTNQSWDVFVHDRRTALTTRISQASTGKEANGTSYLPSLSADGALVVFTSEASNLTADDNDDQINLFLSLSR